MQSHQISGIGIDIIEIDRIRRAVERWGDRFLKRVFTNVELEYCLSKAVPYPHLAARMAAKEAAYKALGLPGASWRDFWVENHSGAPRLCCTELVKTHRDGVTFQITLSHSRKDAIAMVLAYW